MKRVLNFAVQWHITSVCPNHCLHCYMFDSNYQDILKNELNIEQQKIFLNTIKEFEEKYNVFIPTFALTGGDPLSKKGWFELAKLLQEENREIFFMGVPETLNSENIQKLTSLKVKRFQQSLDGLEETHDLIRGKGSFQRTIKGMEKLLSHGILPTIMFTLHEKNKDELIPLIRYLSTQINRFAFAFDFVVCEGEKNFSSTILKSDVLNLFNEYIALKKELENKNGNIHLLEKSHLFAMYHERQNSYFDSPASNTYSRVGGCYNGFSSLAILANGDVMACRRLNIVIGNLLSDSFEDVFLSHPLMKKFRRREFYHDCGNCEHYLVCQGCPAVSYGDSGDMFAKPSFCFKELLPQTNNKKNFSEPIPSPDFDCTPEEELLYILKTMKNQAILLQSKEFSPKDKYDIYRRIFSEKEKDDKILDVYRCFMKDADVIKLK